MDKIDDYQMLLRGYTRGLYTRAEVVSMSVDLLYESSNREALWLALKPEHRETMIEWLIRFDESAEPFAIRGDPLKLWRVLSEVKQWLVCRGSLQA